MGTNPIPRSLLPIGLSGSFLVDRQPLLSACAGFNHRHDPVFLLPFLHRLLPRLAQEQPVEIHLSKGLIRRDRFDEIVLSRYGYGQRH